jgi:hypothetical protein
MICQYVTLSEINRFLAFAANTTKSQSKSLFLLKERAILHDVTNKRLCIVVRNSSSVDKFYILVLANWTCKLTVTYKIIVPSVFPVLFIWVRNVVSQAKSLHSVCEETAEKKQLVDRGVYVRRGNKNFTKCSFTICSLQIILLRQIERTSLTEPVGRMQKWEFHANVGFVNQKDTQPLGTVQYTMTVIMMKLKNLYIKFFPISGKALFIVIFSGIASFSFW